MATPDRATKDGYDEQIQTNHLSHFLLTKDLFPLLEQQANKEDGGDARIVNHSSEARNNTASKGLERKYFEKSNGDGNLGGDRLGIFSGPCFERYCQSKLANSVFTHALHDKLQAAHSKVKVVSAHPGGAATNLGSHLNFGTITNWLMENLLFPMVVQSSEDGTMGLLKGMMGDKDTVESGVMYGPNGMKGKAVALDPKPWEIDINAKQMLWETSEAATGVKFDVIV
ncbi:short-chain dehydrogenase/reductase SDR [Nitzschia inconspicua]|uniref:Short-chain dehydrogenase/reductase SDR n=1 Tax=Nitzschia inconspicua TaxID=303405 RepID=A0A9K3KCE9_9STRA|nr:short-chain dehydrogenase/reductase SDR [Nitzschia inconspicua]